MSEHHGLISVKRPACFRLSANIVDLDFVDKVRVYTFIREFYSIHIDASFIIIHNYFNVSIFSILSMRNATKPRTPRFGRGHKQRNTEEDFF